MWWFGDLLGVLTLTPLAYGLFGGRTQSHRKRALEAAALLLFLGAATVGLYRLPQSHALPSSVLYLFLLWAALRFGAMGVAAATTLLAVLAVRLTEMGFGPYSFHQQPHARLFMVQVTAGTGALLFYILAAVMDERRAAESDLQQSNLRLDKQVRERTAELAEAHGRLEFALKAGGLGYWSLTLPDLVLTSSDRCRANFGIEPADKFTYPILVSMIHPEDRVRQDAAVAQALATGEDYAIEYRINTPGGENRWIDARGRAASDAQGVPLFLTGTTQDITTRKRAEENIRISEERLRLATEAASMFAWEIDLTAHAMHYSDNAAELIGCAPEELPSASPDSMFYVAPEERARLYAEFEQYLRTGREYFASEFLSRDQRFWQAHSLILRDAAGRPFKVIGVTQDITARKQIELEREQLLEREQRARALAEDANRAKDQWLAMVTHELRSPLNAILGHARLLDLRRAQLPAEFAGFADMVRRNGERQNELINDLLDTARMATGKLQLEPGPVSLTGVIADALDAVRPAAQARGISLLTNIDLSVGVITGDAARLQQVVWNLLTNAVKFTPPGGAVVVGLCRNSEQIVLMVSDTGQGIAPEFLPHVFERFSQADTSRTRRHGGLGLGLALTKQIVELHGGTIEAASDGLGQGASFTVSLPAKHPENNVSNRNDERRKEESAQTDFLIASIVPRLNGIPILVIEDEPDARELVATLLRRQDATVESVASTAAAWPLLTAATRPRVLVCDIGLPEEDGYSLLTRLRQWEQEHGKEPLPAIALTAHNNIHDRLQALTAGFHMHVAKPMDPEEFLLVLKSLLERTRMTENAANK